MSVLIFIDTAEGHVKKSSLEAMSYGAKVAEQLGTTAEGVVLGSVYRRPCRFGKIWCEKNSSCKQRRHLNHLDAQVYTKVIAQVAEANGCQRDRIFQ